MAGTWAAAAASRRLTAEHTQGRAESDGGGRASQAGRLDRPVEPRQRDRDAHVADDDDRRRHDERDDRVGVVDGRHQVAIQRLQRTPHSNSNLLKQQRAKSHLQVAKTMIKHATYAYYI